MIRSEPKTAGTSRRRGQAERWADALVPRRLRSRREQIQYLVVGGWNTLFGYLNFVVLYRLFSPAAPVAAILVVSYALSITNAYICYRYIVFRSRGIVWREIPRFSSVYLVALGANLIVLPLALRTLPLSVYTIQILFTACVVVLSYAGHKYFSFREKQVTVARGETRAEDLRSRGV